MWGVLWKQVKGILPGMIYLGIVIAIIRYFHLRIIGIVVLLLIMKVLTECYQVIIKKKKFSVKAFITSTLTMVVILGAILGAAIYLSWKWGVYGSLIFVFLWCGYRLIRGRKQYVEAMETIETSIWGEPLVKKKEEKEN